MRPTVESRLGFENKLIRNPGGRRIAKRCDGSESLCSVVRSDSALSKVSRRDVRTQPGVLTPGTDQKNDPPHRGGRTGGPLGKQVPNSRGIRDFVCRPREALRSRPRFLAGGVLEYWSIGVLRLLRIA